MKLVTSLISRNVPFMGNRVDTQNNDKYVFDIDNSFIEAAYIEHFFQGTLTKRYVELSTSFGCPAKCKFCASEEIKGFEPAKPSDLMKILDFTINKHNLENENFAIPLTGIGELLYTADTIVEFMKQCSKKYPNVKYGLSTVCLTEDVLKKLEPFAKQIQYLQLTEVGDNARAKLMPKLKDKPSVSGTVDLIRDSVFKGKHKFNHITIKDINDSETDFNIFADSLDPIKDFTRVRIAQMNETNASKKYRLLPCSLESLKQFSEILNIRGIKNIIAYANTDFKANCGQLLAETNQKCSRD